MNDVVREVVTATTIIFGSELVSYAIMEILVVIIRVATVKRNLKVDV
jgi:hypothetical protein